MGCENNKIDFYFCPNCENTNASLYEDYESSAEKVLVFGLPIEIGELQLSEKGCIPGSKLKFYTIDEENAKVVSKDNHPDKYDIAMYCVHKDAEHYAMSQYVESTNFINYR